MNVSASEDAFEDLFLQVRPAALRVLSKYRIPTEDGDDLLQETMLLYWHKQHEVRHPERWLLGVLRNQCRRYWQARKSSIYQAVDGSILELVSDPVRPPQERSDAKRDVSILLQAVSGRCRSLLALRYGLGYKAVEAARELGYKASGAHKIMQRCMSSLTDALAGRAMLRSSSDA